MTTAVSGSDGVTPLPPILRHILHPSDFSAESRFAFLYALKAALIAKCELTLIHVTNDDERDWREFPGVRETLERWGIFPPGSDPDAEIDLGIQVSRIIGRGRDPVEGVLAFLQEQSVDLIVLATNHHGFDWLHRSVSEPVARKSGEMTLFVPAEAHGFISPAYGTVSLQNILIPVAEKPSSKPAVDGATRLVRQLQCEEGTFTLLHVGEDEPKEATPNVPGWKWRRVARKGNVIDVILETAEEKKADLIVMSTDGRNGFLDALRGSHSERVLRRTPCPVLVIPEHSHGANLIEKAANPDWYQERKRPLRRRPATDA